MKDNSLDGHRGKVAVSDTSRVTTAGSSVKCDLKTSVTTAASDGAATTNFDDDYNEWELGIGDLIIDLDADIEKTNTNHHHHHHQNGTVVGNSPGASTAVSPSSVGAASFAFLGSQSCTPAMSNSKSSRLISGTNNSGSAGSTTGGTSVSANSTGGTAGAVEHQATVDKGLKMKIKRKTVGNKYSEAKHEIVQSDTKSVPAHPLCENMASSNAASGQNSVPSSETKSKHSSSKGRTSSHRDKKEKNRDKDKSANTKAVNSSAEVNGAMSGMSPSLKITNSGVNMSPLTPSSGTSTITQNGNIVPSLPQTSTSCRSVPTSSCNSNCSSSSSTSTNSVTSSATAIEEPVQMSCPAPPACSPPMPNLTLKLENKFTTGQPSVVVKQEDRLSPPLKKLRTDDSDKVDTACSPAPPEMKDTSTCTSVGTITEPDCLGPCEPGTSVMLEGIVWQETEGGVLVVNVTWRGKTYVGTLLDCTKHDWAPPRFCESPTSDVDSKTSKGRGKRGRGSNNNVVDVNAYNDARNCVQSKLRNGKGRRTTVNSSNSNSGFTVPSSPAKSDNGVPTNNKRKGRPAEVEVSTPQTDSKSSKRSRSQSRGTPTPSSSISAAEFSQPSSPVLIECPEPNCSKKYKHINGLRYHQTHAHSGLDGSKLEDSNSEDIKDATNSSDNEESIQESMSVPPSPAMSFRNSASPRPTNGRTLQGENTSSLSCSSLPESDPYSLTPDLSTLASVAISDSKAAQKSENVSKATPPPHPATTPELTPVVSSEAVKTPSILPAMSFSASQCPSSPVSVPPAISTESNSVSVPVPAVTTTSVIHSPATMDVSVVSPSVTVSIPTSHVVLSQGITIGGNSVTTTTHTTSTVVCHNPANVVSRNNLAPATTTTTSFVSVPPLPVTSTTTLCSSPITSIGDKSKIKQDKLEKYKPKSPLATTPAIRPIVPAPSPQLITLSTNIPVSHPSISPGSHNLVTSSLKPIQPKPTILGEPPTISPALESLKKEKSKHKKKSKDKDKEKEKKTSVPMPPSSVRHVSSRGGEECEAMDITPYPNLEAVPGTRDSLNAAVSLPPASHTSMSPLPNQPKPSDSALDMNVADDNMNENIQSPAYSDISDANDTAPVLESEVPSGKEKEDKVGKSTPDTPQSPAANISAYGMYPYYSQPPYLLPSVSPQNSVPAPQMASVADKPESSKKLEQDRIKENRPWSNSSGEITRERQSATEHDSSEKKSMRGEESAPSSSVIPSPSSSAAIQDYPMQQHYPYSYGYVQNYQYSVEPSYMQLLETDPHYKQQYKQYIEEQQRLYKDQHHQQQHHHHHHQQQQQQHSHHSHSQQHHSSHQSKNQHHSSSSSSSSSVKEERGREKERAMPEKLSNSGMVMDHSGKQQHSSLSLVVNKEHDAPRDPETRPPSLPAQARVDSSTPSSASAAAALKEKQNENHQILKENIELKSQMDASKNKVNQYEMAMLYERHRDDMRRYYIYQQQHKVEAEQQQQQQQHHHMSPHPSSLSSSLKSHKDDVVALSSSQSKPNHFTEGSRSSVISPPKSDHIKCSTSQPNSTSSPKTSVREPPVSIPKEYSSSSGITGSSSKKESSSSSKAPVERLDSSVREEKNKSDKSKVEVKVEPEGQKPTMETTGPPPPPTNSYAYLHPSYLPPAPPHFPHMPFEAAHAVYRGGINPMLMSSPHYSSSPYVHQLRYPTPGACDLPAPSQPVDPLGNKLHAPGPGKALDLLHQVSQHYTTHKIHELQEHALMSPTPTSTPSSTPSTSSNAPNKVSSTEPVMTVAKVESGATRDSSRSPPTQRHLHTHHHTHVGVGYPIYDPYGGLRKPCS